MTAGLPKVKALFLHAVEQHAPDQWATYLDDACGDDAALRGQVEILLDAHRSGASLLDKGAFAGGPTAEHVISERPGIQIGPYKLLQELGQGGMGVVFMAEQKEPVKRRVALKVIKPGMDTKQVIARFEAERQALALMDHPNIASVLDAGATDSGRPYFVMELVNGIPITKYCDEQHLTPQQRLSLFLPICHAIQHAHQKGIIHRDLKPSNVLVALYDHEAVPKVIDFGVAKATSQILTEKTLFTQLGQIVGTLEYMSPEQAQRNQLDIDTRSDVYSLGVILYELLTGTTPFEKGRLRAAALDEVLRIIREEEPPRPSTRLSSIETLPSVAANRHTEPRKLSTLVRGELDWIVMKALEKDRGRRYETADGFAADIKNYLADEPVIACPPTVAYRFRKFASRNRAALATASMVAVALVLGVIGTSWQAFVATKALEFANLESSRARRAEHKAENEAARATREAERADARSQQLAQEVRVSKAMRLAAQAQSVREEFPIRSLLLATEAVDATRAHNELVVPIARQALLNTVSIVGGQPLVGHDEFVRSLTISPDSRWLATGGSRSSVVQLWDLSAEDPAASQRVLQGHTDAVWSVTVGLNSQWLVTGSGDKTARLWNLKTSDPASSSIVLEHDQRIRSTAISSNGRWLVTASGSSAHLWDLNDQSFATPAFVLNGHEGTIHTIAISPDSHWLATGSADKTARLWDLVSQNPAASPRVLRGHDAAVSALEINSDSRWLVTAGVGGEEPARLWSLSGDDPSSSGAVLDGSFGGLAMSPDGRWLAAGSQLVGLNSQDPAESRRELEAFLGLQVFSPNSDWLVTRGSSALDIQLWDLRAEDPMSTPRQLRGHSLNVMSAAFSPDGRWLATCSLDKTVRIWDLRSKDLSRSSQVLRGHDRAVFGVAFTPDGRWLVTGSDDHTARLWRVGPQGPASSDLVKPAPSAISSDGRWLATGDTESDRSVRLWDLTSQDFTLAARTFEDERNITSLAISPDNRWLAAGALDGTTRLWDLSLRDATPLTLAGHESQVGAIIFSQDSRRVVTAGAFDKTARVWKIEGDTPTGAPLHVLEYEGPVGTAKLSQDGRWLVVATGFLGPGENSPRLWDLRSPDVVSSARDLTGHQSSLTSLEFSGDGRWLATGSRDGTARLWDLKASDPVASPSVFKHGRLVESLTISPDSSWLVTGSMNSTTRVWDLTAIDTDSPSLELRGHGHGIRSLSMSSDSRLLVTGSWDRTARVWDLAAPDPRKSSIWLPGHASYVGASAISSDGHWLVTVAGSEVRLWDLQIDSLVNRASRLAGRELTDAETTEYMLDEL